MASRSSQPGKRPRRPGERTEKERRAPQGSAPPKAGVHPTGGYGAGQHGPGSYTPVRTTPAHTGANRGTGASVPAVSGITLIYGRNPVREALRGRRRVHAVWLISGDPGDGLEQTLQGWVMDTSAPAA